MSTISPDEIKAQNIAAMGQELGEQYSQLWQELAFLHSKWAEYVGLFGTTSQRIDLLNEAADHLFALLQDEMWGGILLHIARLTDPSKSAGKLNLTLKSLPTLVNDKGLQAELNGLLADLVSKTEFCREWRNKLLAHTDLQIALEHAQLATEGSRHDVSSALQACVNILSVVSVFYLGADTGLDAVSPPGGSLDLLHIIHDGLKARRERDRRFENDEATEAEYLTPDL